MRCEFDPTIACDLNKEECEYCPAQMYSNKFGPGTSKLFRRALWISLGMAILCLGAIAYIILK
jgi:hypothetical protein